MEKYLIIGKDGALGGEFQRLLGDQAIYTDRNTLDITKEDKVIEFIQLHKPSVVINCAAYNAVDKAEAESETAMLINGYAVGHIASAAQSVDAKFVHFSTNYVFDGTNVHGYKEDDPTSPQSIYGKSKLLGEEETLQKNNQGYVIRTAWLYGQQGSSPTAKVNFVNRILQLAQEKDTLEGVNDQYGQPTWTKDLAEFTLKLIQSNESPGIYHGTNQGSATWFTWMEEILRQRGINRDLNENSISNFPSSSHTASRPQHGILLCTKTTPMRPWQEALGKYMESL